MDKLKTFLVEEDGATAVEYGLIVAAIAAVIVAAVMTFAQVDGNVRGVSAAIPARE